MNTTKAPKGRSSPRLFDLRLLISVVLGLYGVILLALGLSDTSKSLQKADGLAINLWMGIGLLVVAALFGLWQWLDRNGGRPS